MSGAEGPSDSAIFSALSTPPAVAPEDLKEDVREFPIPTRSFVKSLVNTSDEIFGRLLLLDHAGEARTESDWRDTLAAIKQRGA